MSCCLQTEEGFEPDYRIGETLPKDTSVPDGRITEDGTAMFLERNTVQVHYIKSVAVNTSAHVIHWHRHTEPDDSVF